MTTTADLIQETKAHLFSGQEPEANRLASNITSGATSMTLSYDKGSISKGAIISIDLEDIRVWSTSGATTLDVVERGVNGTTAVAHTALDYIQVRPKFSDFRILRAINEELADLASPMNGLFRVATVDLTYNAATQGYDLTSATNVTRILEMRYKVPGSSKSWPSINRYSLLRDMSTSDFASGFSVVLYEDAFPGMAIRVRYATDFAALTTLAQDVQSIAGLPATANDIPPLGAAIRLVAPREINRNFTEAQGDPHRLEEVPPGAIMQSTRDLQVLRQRRIIAEAARLQADWPLVR